MKVKESTFLSEKKPLFKKLLDKLLKEYEYASILAVDSLGKRYNVSKNGIGISSDNALFTQRGFTIKVYSDGCFAEYSANSIDENSIDDIVKIIKEKLTVFSSSRNKSHYELPDDEPLVFNKSTEYEKDPEEMGDEEIVKRLKTIHEDTLKKDERVVDCITSYTYQKYSKLFLSKNRDMVQNVMWGVAFAIVLAAKGEEIKDAYRPVSILGGAEIFDMMSDNVDKAVKEAIELIDSEPLKPGTYECICSPETTGMIVHEAFGHGVEMDMFVKDRALAKDFIGEYVASPLITMHDGNKVDDTATYFFDDEGTLSEDTIIIEKGILKAGISDLQSAKALGTKPTGNGRRQDYTRKAYTRMTNTYFEEGTDKLEDMIASVKDGLFLESPSSGMEDPKNWGIQCMVSVAREIKDGKFTGKIYSPIILTGYVPDLLKSITMVSDKKEILGSGFCGKGHKEWVKVSDGGPYIKATINLG